LKASPQWVVIPDLVGDLQALKVPASRQGFFVFSKSLIGRFWRFHIKFCPGWKAYMKSLPDDERAAIKEKYGL